VDDVIDLAARDETGDLPLFTALARRRSERAFAARPVSLRLVGRLLWAAQGLSNPEGRRTAPSAGALYPLEIDVVMADGVYRYRPAGHSLLRRAQADRRTTLTAATWGGQGWIAHAACIFVISGVVERTARKYGARAERYVLLEAGHAAQNLLLAATTAGLGATPVGAFADDSVARTLELGAGELPLYLLPVGWPADAAATR
jgi:SagB-type dehydrogenase family enzyme